MGKKQGEERGRRKRKGEAEVEVGMKQKAVSTLKSRLFLHSRFHFDLFGFEWTFIAASRGNKRA